MLITFGAVGGFAWISSLDTANITDFNSFWNLFGGMITGVLIGLFIAWIFGVLGAIYLRKSYKSIAKIPEPKLSAFSIKGVFEQVHILLKRELESRGISFEFGVYPDALTLTADEKLLEQVLINLMRNAMEAVNGIDDPKIFLKAFESESDLLIKVIDNGEGISSENMENIFVPFFTTKEAGSGIGLSFSRQIMRAHKGKILAFSEPGNTELTLVF